MNAPAKSIKHQVPEKYRDVPLSTLIETRVARYRELEADWDAFADSQLEGRRRGQRRFIGAGGSGKHDPKAVPAGGFTLSILTIPPGQGGSAHTHEVEEAFFVLQGQLTVFMENDRGERASTTLKKWETISCPEGIPHGFVNEGTEDAYVQVMIGTGRPGPVGYSDDGIYAEETTRLASRAQGKSA